MPDALWIKSGNKCFAQVFATDGFMAPRPSTMDEQKTDLREILATDDYNVEVSDKIFKEHGLRQPLDEALSLFDRVLGEFYKTFPPNDVSFWEEGGKPKSHIFLRVIMLLSASTQFHLAACHLMRGQANEVWGHSRRAIEAAGIAYLSLADPAIGQLYLEHNIREFKARTKTSEILPADNPLTQELNRDFEHSSQRTHQNFISTASRLGHTMGVLGRRFTFALHHHVYDMDLEAVLTTTVGFFKL